MSFLSRMGAAFLDGIGPIDVQARSSEFPSFETQMAAIQRRPTQTYRLASVDEALSVPAISAAVTLIAGTMGTLTMDAYRNERLVPSMDRPKLIVRPNPFSKPYTFWFLSAFYKATRGERWWWVAKRDPIDGTALSLFPVPPWEITVEQNDRDRLRPIIKWADRTIPNEDMISDFWFPDHSGLRGKGPLQVAGAAVSAAVEAQQWAANFFSGSLPSIVGTTEQDMDAGELALLDQQWAEKAPGLPRWLTNDMKLSEAPFDPEKAQLTESRQFDVGNVARLFSMPGSLLEYQMSGSSLTYRNDSGIWTDFQRRCLGPIFAEPVEQDMSDLLTRSHTAQFNFDRLLRADIETRFEAYKVGIEAGFLTPDEARQREGLEPGSSEYAPVPFAAPQAIPTLLPPNREIVATRSSLADVFCPKCGKIVGRAAGAAEIMCRRCRVIVTQDAVVEVQARTALDVLHDAVTREPPPAPNVNVTSPPQSVTFEAGAIQVAAPDMAPMTELAASISEMANRPAPANEITVHPSEVHIDEGAIRVEMPPVEIQPPAINVEAPNVTVNVPEQRPMRREVKRDKANNIISIEEVPA